MSLNMEDKPASENLKLISCVVSMLDTEVYVETADNNKYCGKLAACSKNFDIGLECARKCSDEAEQNCEGSEVINKIQFKAEDVVSIYGAEESKKDTAAADKDKSPPKEVKGFAIDADISKTKNGIDHLEREFIAWEGDEDYNEEDINQKDSMAVRGWSAEEMFATNKQFGITTSFNEDMSQYTTVEARGDKIDREKADKIASIIEKNLQSRRNAQLENDDVERDLHEKTRFANKKNDNEFIHVTYNKRHDGSQRNTKPKNNRFSDGGGRYIPPAGRRDQNRQDDRNRKRADIPATSSSASLTRGSPVGYTGSPTQTSKREEPQKQTAERVEHVASPQTITNKDVETKTDVCERPTEQNHSVISENAQPTTAVETEKQQSKEEEQSAQKSSKSESFKFNPDATPFIPKQKDAPVTYPRRSDSSFNYNQRQMVPMTDPGVNPHFSQPSSMEQQPQQFVAQPQFYSAVPAAFSYQPTSSSPFPPPSHAVQFNGPQGVPIASPTMPAGYVYSGPYTQMIAQRQLPNVNVQYGYNYPIPSSGQYPPQHQMQQIQPGESPQLNVMQVGPPPHMPPHGHPGIPSGNVVVSSATAGYANNQDAYAAGTVMVPPMMPPLPYVAAVPQPNQPNNPVNNGGGQKGGQWMPR
ncbi:ataxin 2 SM domain-containing protein [Ditylenchus destructor]|nr:ataxin 2 SM domain-containing protein [Ditylenchus destructor]